MKFPIGMKLAKSTKSIVGFVALLCFAVSLLFVSKQTEPFVTPVPLLGSVMDVNLTQYIGSFIAGFSITAIAAKEYQSLAPNAKAAFEYLKTSGIQLNVFDVSSRQLILGHRDITLFIDDCINILRTAQTSSVPAELQSRVQKFYARFNNATYNKVRSYAVIFNYQFTGIPVGTNPNSLLMLSGQQIVTLGNRKPVLALSDVQKVIPNQSSEILILDPLKNQIRNSKGIVLFDSATFMKFFSGQEQQKIGLLTKTTRFCNYDIIDCKRFK